MSNATQEHIRRIRADCLFGKKKHFNAGDRKDRLANWLTIPVVIINVLIGSTLFGLLKESVPEWTKWAGAFLAFVAAVLAGLQGYFGLHKAAAGHRTVGTRYLALMKACDMKLAFITDGLLGEGVLRDEVNALATELDSINLDAQSYTTNQTDIDLARKSIAAGDEGYTAQELGR